MGPRLVSPGKEGSLHGARGACTQAATSSGTLPNGVVETTTIWRVHPNIGQSTPYGPTVRAYPRQGVCPGGILVAKDPAHACTYVMAIPY